MRKVNYFFAAIAIGALMVSCGSSSKIGTSKSKDIIGVGVIQMPVVVDLEVNENKEVYSKSFKVVKATGNYTDLKNETSRELLNKSDSDLLIEPSYEILQEGSRVTITVKGFPAKYKNFRTAKESDIAILEIQPGVYQTATRHSSATETRKTLGGKK